MPEDNVPETPRPDAPAGAGPADTTDNAAKADTTEAAGGTAQAQQAPGESAEELRSQRDDYYDRLLRKTAEFDNYRKRVQRERREMAQFAAAEVLEALLPIVDDLERALRVEAGPDTGSYRQGVELIHRQMLDLLARQHVTPIEAVGTPFDPRIHQAVMCEVSPGHAEGEVIEEVRRGYVLGERLLRPAMVKVAKA